MKRSADFWPRSRRPRSMSRTAPPSRSSSTPSNTDSDRDRGFGLYGECFFPARFPLPGECTLTKTLPMGIESDRARRELMRLALEHRAQLWGFLMGLTKDPQKAEDLFQNTYLVLCEK